MIETILNSLCLPRSDLSEKVHMFNDARYNRLEDQEQFDLIHFTGWYYKHSIYHNVIPFIKDSDVAFSFYFYATIEQDTWRVDDFKIVDYYKSWWLIDKVYTESLLKDLWKTQYLK